MASSTRTRKAKGKRLQLFVRDVLREVFKGMLDPEDIQSTIASESGVDIKTTPAAKKLFKLDIECKNQEKFNINASLKQAEDNTEKGRIPAVVFSKNNSKIYIALEFMEFLKMAYPHWTPSPNIKGKSVIQEKKEETTENTEVE